MGVQLEGEHRGTLLFSYGGSPHGKHHLSYEVNEDYVLCYCIESSKTIVLS